VKYETPELTPLTPAVSAIQTVAKPLAPGFDSDWELITPAYADWEE
jgi:hypothetical protein